MIKGVILQSGDGLELTVGKEEAQKASETLCNLIEDVGDDNLVIPLPHIKAHTLSLIVDIIQGETVTYGELSVPDIVQLVNALNYLAMTDVLTRKNLWNSLNLYIRKGSPFPEDVIPSVPLHPIFENSPAHSFVFFEKVTWQRVPPNLDKPTFVDLPTDVWVRYILPNTQVGGFGFIQLAISHPNVWHAVKVFLLQNSPKYEQFSDDVACSMMLNTYTLPKFSSKHHAKEHYVLSDKDLSTLTRHYGKFCYFREELILKAFEKHGSAAGIESARQKRKAAADKRAATLKRKREEAEDLRDRQIAKWTKLLNGLSDLKTDTLISRIFDSQHEFIDLEDIRLDNPRVIRVLDNYRGLAHLYICEAQYDASAEILTKKAFKEAINRLL